MPEAEAGVAIAGDVGVPLAAVETLDIEAPARAARVNDRLFAGETELL